jgi:hypothetical protein
MKSAKIVIFIFLFILLTACGPTTTYFYNTRAHTLGLKQSVVTKKEGTFSLFFERSDMQHDDVITKKKQAIYDNYGNHTGYEEYFFYDKYDEVDSAKKAISMEYALTSNTTLGLAYTWGRLNGRAIDKQTQVTRNDLTIKHTSFNGFSASVKHKLIDTRDNLSLSAYGRYEGMEFSNINLGSNYDLASHELFAGVITGYQSSDDAYFCPSLSTFASKTWNTREFSLEEISRTHNITSVGLELNLLLNLDRVSISSGYGLQSDVSKKLGDAEQYLYFRMGIDVFKG